MRTRLTLLTIVLACAGSFIFAPSALAWFGRVQVEKVNQGGNPGDVFVFQPALTWTGEGSPVTSDFTLVGGQQSQPFDVACNAEFPNDVTCGPHFSNVSLKVGELPSPATRSPASHAATRRATTSTTPSPPARPRRPRR
jgi:hypothetical protein